MKAKDLITALERLDPEQDVVINIMQDNKVHGVIQLPIEYGSKDPNDFDYLHFFVNKHYGGSITVYLPEKAYIAKLPK